MKIEQMSSEYLNTAHRQLLFSWLTLYIYIHLLIIVERMKSLFLVVQVASRRVIQSAAILMLLAGVFGKFGAFLLLFLIQSLEDY